MNKNFNPLHTAVIIVLLGTLALGAPTAKFTATPKTGEAPLEVQFDASQTILGNHSIQGYHWDFQGDGYIDKEGLQTTYTYYSLGEHTATLEVVDTEGQKDTYQENITVQRPSQGQVLQTEAKDNGDGYLYLEAIAGQYSNNTFTCQNTTVKAEVKNIPYKLKKPEGSYCTFSKEIKTGPGTYEVEFKAEYPDGKDTETMEITVEGKKPNLEIYSPEEDLKVVQDAEVFIEAQATQYRTYLTGEFTAKIGNRSTELDKTQAGTYSGKMNVEKPGNKTIQVKFQNQEWTLEKNRSIRVLNSSSDKAKELEPSMNILYPSPYIKINKNESLIFEIELLDSSSRPMSDQQINYTLEGPGNTTNEGKINQGDYLYSKILEFPNPGKYRFTATWKNLEEKVNITVGPEEEIPEEQKLQTEIITPRPTVYSYGNELMIQTAVTKHNEFIENATVFYVLDNQEEEQMNPTQKEGEYQTSLGVPEKGRHTVTVVAKHGKEEARETVPFKISDKYLEPEIIHPPDNETLNLTEGNRIDLKANVTDQNNVVARNALVTAQFTSPTGKESEMKMKQEEDIYRVSYYPEETGELEVKVTAQKPNHVEGETTTTLSLIVNEKKSEAEKAVGKLTIRTLLKIALGLAIIILLLALVTRIL